MIERSKPGPNWNKLALWLAAAIAFIAAAAAMWDQIQENGFDMSWPLG